MWFTKKRKMVCVKINEKYAHHRKLKIGKVYECKVHNGFLIIDKYGFYWLDMFVDVANKEIKK
jgi:hypothetical protein